MSFSAELRAYLGLDTKGFSGALRTAAAEAASAGARIEDSFKRSSGAHENLLASNHRVARQIQNFSRDVLSGANATDVLSSGLEGLEKALKLPLGALAGIGVTAVFVSQISSAITAYRQLNKELDALGKSRGDLGDISTKGLEEHAEQAKKKIEELDKAHEGFFKRAFTRAYEGVSNAFGGKARDTLKSPEDSVAERRANISFERRQDQAELARREGLQNEIKNSHLPDFQKEAARLKLEFQDKLNDALANHNGAEAQTLLANYERDLKAIAERVAKANRERVQGTLDEIADRPDKLDNSLTIQAFSEGQQAREAKRLRAEAAIDRDTIGGEAGLQIGITKLQRSDALINGITSIRDNEKIDVRAEIDASTILSQIKASIDKLSFTNQ